MENQEPSLVGIIQTKLKNSKRARLGIEVGPYNESHKHHISDALKGKPKSDEHKQALSESRKASGVCVGEKNPMFGKTHDAEARRKMSEANSKPIEQWAKDGNGLIYIFSSIREASEKTGANASCISRCANGKPKNKTAGGFVWKYAKSSKS